MAKSKCDHKGQWRGLGVSTFQVGAGFRLAHNLYCQGCGESKINILDVGSQKGNGKKKTKIAVPRMRVGFNPKGRKQ